MNLFFFIPFCPKAPTLQVQPALAFTSAVLDASDAHLLAGSNVTSTKIPQTLPQAAEQPLPLLFLSLSYECMLCIEIILCLSEVPPACHLLELVPVGSSACKTLGMKWHNEGGGTGEIPILQALGNSLGKPPHRWQNKSLFC